MKTDNIDKMETPYGYCQCGCGQKTNIVKESGHGYKKGDCYKYLFGHHMRRLKNDGRKSTGNGYISVKTDNHPRNPKNGYVLEHIIIVEKALGHPIPKGAVIHHIDQNKSNNNPNNLVLCPNTSYHKLLHRRMKALEACGNANWLKCPYCKQYDDPKNMYISKVNPNWYYHRKCQNKKRLEIYYANKSKQNKRNLG